MRRSELSKPVVWRWQERFMREGIDGLMRDKTREPGKTPLPAETVQRVVDLALGAPPGEATHWTGRMLAKAVGVSLRSVQRILEVHRLAPHRIRTFKLSNDPKFAEKLKDVVGLYIDPPAHAVAVRRVGQDLSGPGHDAGRHRPPCAPRHDPRDERRELPPQGGPRPQTRTRPAAGTRDAEGDRESR